MDVVISTEDHIEDLVKTVTQDDRISVACSHGRSIREAVEELIYKGLAYSWLDHNGAVIAMFGITPLYGGDASMWIFKTVRFSRHIKYFLRNAPEYMKLFHDLGYRNIFGTAMAGNRARDLFKKIGFEVNPIAINSGIAQIPFYAMKHSRVAD